MVEISIDNDYTFNAGRHRFGFVDLTVSGFDMTWSYTDAELGSLGTHRVPVSAATAWALVVISLLLMVALVAIFAKIRDNSQTLQVPQSPPSNPLPSPQPRTYPDRSTSSRQLSI